MNDIVLTGIVLFSVFFLLIIIGVPISIGIGIASFSAALVILPFWDALMVLSQQFITGIDSFVLLALVFFTLAGSIMNTGGIALRLINLAKLLGGRMSGSLAHTNVIGNTLFGSISGSAIASAATMGRIMGPMQKKEGYDPSYSAAVNIASAPTGLVIPPSGTPILYSLLTGGTSIGALFIAGYLPGFLMAFLVMVVAYIIAKRKGYSVENPVPFSEALKVILQAIPALFLIVVVIGGIAGGIFTATEGAAVAVLYSILLSLCYRSLKFKDIPIILKDTVIFSGIILLLIGASSAMSWVLSYSKIPQAVSSGLLGITENGILLVLIMVLLLLVLGTFMDIAPALLIFTPILFPVATSLGIHPVHFGMIMSLGLAIGTTTPPVGTVLFIGSKVGNVSVEQVIKPLLVFYIPMVVALLAVAFIPEISLWLPRLFGLID
ncbi:TRAP transporter large permease [Alkalicoccobacillus murimartini]|uniref:Tripartite ATP-independent transporter DctM subunit n=1 Tax=Alkalicoccobacillus murimartini TaxID=171685 RepID=A0ABT9YJ26_9BACI|nr:TRAP transporter large permease [Alkalicoccobacillus murimartini]MDQ0207207.1 tripartite ATP-independent transporter DctM subunit [Alkalicoccobacillus murimartini]